MKKHFRLLTSAAAASFLVSTSFAQQTPAQTVDPGASSQTETNSDRATVSGSVERNSNSATNTVTDANNSGLNVRDRHDQTLTPGDQRNNSTDLDTTRKIRKEITSTKDMSVSARNVKIITAKGRVTLRGPVQTEQEKRLIGEIASKVAQPQNVDNQLEVKVAATGRINSTSTERINSTSITNSTSTTK